MLGLALTGGCGFHLRDQAASLELSSLHIDAKDVNSELLLRLETRLGEMGVPLLPATGKADWVLRLWDHRVSRRIASTNARITVERYELTQRIDFQIQSASGTTAPETLSMSRSYDYDPSNLVGSASEEALLNAELQQELVERILTRLVYSSAGRP